MVSKELSKVLVKNKIDAIIIFNKSPFFQYFIPEKFDKGILILTKKQKILFVSRLYSPNFPGFKVTQYEKFKDDFAKMVSDLKLKTVGYDGSSILLKHKKFASKYFKTKDVSSDLIPLRDVKTDLEIKHIKQACKVTDDVFSQIIKNFKSFKMESDLVKFIKLEIFKRDCELAFEPIVASGRNAVTAHHNTDSKLQKGFMVLDFGAKYKGYCSDMTRTIYLGVPTDSEIKIYEKLLKTQESCIDAVRIGLKANELHLHAMKQLGPDSQYFVHGLGHGFGIEIHETPSLSLNSKDILRKGSVVTIEPGYYNQKTGIGIRIEDDIYLGEKKEILTKSTKNLICIKK